MPDRGSRSTVAAVVLAAGASRRLGQPKQLLLMEGESLVHRTARLALEAGCAPVIVVLGFQAHRLAGELADLTVEIATNANWSSGMGSSLACGAAAARRSHPEMAALLLLVCDQPRLSTNHLRYLLDRHAEGASAITASAYAGRAGVPAVFAPALVPELERMDGDRGARDLILRHGSIAIDWPDGAMDIDLPEDLPEGAPHGTAS
jgi:molybdenum cofactor cytidylyltransferase